MSDDGQRLDQWLWSARFFKTRALAVQAVKNGRVSVNGQPAKPARKISIGDELHIRKQTDLIFTVTVKDLVPKRVSAKIAATLYAESAESRLNREKLREKQKAARDMVDFPAQRPDKRARRDLRALKHHQE